MKSTLSVISRGNTKHIQSYDSYSFIFNPPSITIHARLKHAVEQYDNYPILEYYQDILKYYLQSVNTFSCGSSDSTLIRNNIAIGAYDPELMKRVYEILDSYRFIPVIMTSGEIKLYCICHNEII